MKGISVMIIYSLTDCCVLLGIDPKTLRVWVKHAQLPLLRHPIDARIKGITRDHVQHLATTHARFIAWPGENIAPPHQSPAKPREPKGFHIESPLIPPEADVLGRLSHLETQVHSLQRHLVQSRLDPLLERAQSDEQQGQSVNDHLNQAGRPEVVAPLAMQANQEPPRPEDGGHTKWDMHPDAKRPHVHITPLVEYGMNGTYIILSSHEGEVHITPDSPEWFDWIASVKSFRFLGKQGRISVYRKNYYGLTRNWYAYRCIHQKNYRHPLGHTDQLTIANLEKMAAQYQTYVNTP
jgi:hypothetical protein